jgi:hypothetical protein
MKNKNRDELTQINASGQQTLVIGRKKKETNKTL